MMSSSWCRARRLGRTNRQDPEIGNRDETCCHLHACVFHSYPFLERLRDPFRITVPRPPMPSLPLLKEDADAWWASGLEGALTSVPKARHQGTFFGMNLWISAHSPRCVQKYLDAGPAEAQSQPIDPGEAAQRPLRAKEIAVAKRTSTGGRCRSSGHGCCRGQGRRGTGQSCSGP